MTIGSGYLERTLCDGKGHCCPGIWTPEERRYPKAETWRRISSIFIHSAEALSTIKLQSELALGRLSVSPFPSSVITRIKQEVVRELECGGFLSTVRHRIAHIFLSIFVSWIAFSFRPQIRRFLPVTSQSEFAWVQVPVCHDAHNFTRRRGSGAFRSNGTKERLMKLWLHRASGIRTIPRYCHS